VIPVNTSDPTIPGVLMPPGVTAGSFGPPIKGLPTTGAAFPGGSASGQGHSSGSSSSTPAGGTFTPPTSTSVGPKDCPPGVPPQVCAMLSIGGGFGKQVEGNLSALMNQGSRFTPEIMQQLAAGSKETADAQVRADIAAGDQDAASRGLYSSGFAADQAAGARRAGADRLAQDVRAQKLEKVKFDFEDKLAGLDRSQKYLDSLRAAASQFNATAADRERNESAIRLGYAQLAQQKSQFVDQLASNKELLGMSLNSAEFLAGLRLQLGLI
jgi:hypothetical protein